MKPVALLVVCVLGCWGVARGQAGDRVRIANGGTGPKGVLVDGDLNGRHENDRSYTAPAVGGFFSLLFPSIPLDNFTPSAQSNEAIAFAPGRPPALARNVFWSPGSTAVDLEFENAYRIAAYAWIVGGPFQQFRERAIADSVETSRIWQREGQGVVFSLFEVRDATGTPGAGNFGIVDCADAATIRQVIGAEPGAINIYYVAMVEFEDGPTQFGAWFCGSGSAFTILMGSGTNGVVLAHEFGHAFDLDHPDDFPTFFDSTNVMWPTVTLGRSIFLTEGQTFRGVFSPGSALNMLYDVREFAPTRACGHSASTTDDACPALQKRIWREGPWAPN